MGLKERVDRLGGKRLIRGHADGLNDILSQEDWVAILEADDPEAELLARCPTYYRLEAALNAVPPDAQGVRRLRI